MNNMFSGSFEFNQPIGEWNVSNCKNFDYMFAGSKKFNQNINNWVIKISVRDRINDMFDKSESFNRINCVWYKSYNDQELDTESDDENSDEEERDSDDELCMCSICKKERLRDLLEDMTAEDIVDVIQDFGFG